MKVAGIASPGALATLLILAACAGQPQQLPEARIDRAATCGVIAAFQARAATTDVQAPLPFEAQGRILHFALLGAIEGDSFSQDDAAAINARMSAIQERIGEGKWDELAPACKAAFPDSTKTKIELPADSFDARLGCDALGDFLGKAMASQESHYGSKLADYAALSAKLDRSTMVSELRRRAGEDREAQQFERHKAMAKIVRTGQPMAVMQACISRYG